MKTDERDEKVVGVLLAGGLATRMGGGDKCLRQLAGRPLLDHLIDVVTPQVDVLALNANGDSDRFTSYGLPVLADVIGGYAGPLAGVLTGLEWTQKNVSDAIWVASFATDAPFLPVDLVARLLWAVKNEGADMACASSQGRVHPVFGIWPVSLAGDLRAAMINEDIRKIDLWTARYNLTIVDFKCKEGNDPFFNINQPDNLAEAGRIMAEL
ncbi:MAG: molybdenum cofactor guanylyltransferase MobA [Magnetovibrio sp.]|nr:molybdenum cofactor guanylyltransferase MobA [Magnetovibrio sp.]